MADPKHTVSIIVNQRQIGPWTEYQIDTSLVEPAESFVLRRNFDRDAWQLCRRDARVRVLIDGIPRISGFVDKRVWNPKEGTLEISGRDIIGRLVDESAPRPAIGGGSLLAVIEQVVSPWFRKVTLSNARNRKVTLGKGSKVPGDSESIALIKGLTAMFAKPSKGGNRIEPGQPRWQVIQDLLGRAGLIAWSSADGQELFVGRPDQTQPALFSIRHSKERRAGVATELVYEESNEGRYAAYVAVGSGNNSAADYGEASAARAGYVYDEDTGNGDGTGRDFLYPKRLILGESAIRDNDEASRVAGKEQAKRDFRRTHLTATMPYHGQLVGGQTPTLFATDTFARVVLEDDDADVVVDEDFLIYAASFRATRDAGETTQLELVPRGTEVLSA